MISKHISFEEAVKSNTATRLNLKNKPSEYNISNMVGIATHVFEPLREYVGGPIKITSMFRSEDLNAAIGGSYKIENGKKIQTSQHCEGRAMDLDDTFGHKSNAEMFHYIKENLNFDQLIWEFGTDENPNWIHVSYVSKEQNRNRCLRAEKINGKTSYRLYNYAKSSS